MKNPLLRYPKTIQQSCASVPYNIKLWHKDNELTARQVFKKSNKLIKWNCFICNHTYYQTASNKNRGYGCPYCSNQKLCENECQTCFQKSCASIPNNVKLWHFDNTLQARQVFKFSNDPTIKWNCFYCSHSYKQCPYSKNGKSQSGCPYCAIPSRRLCENKDCQTCFDKSCASLSDNVKLWHTDNKLQPRQVFQFSHEDYKWNCFNCNHSYYQRPSHKNGKEKCGCPLCANKELCEDPKCQTCLLKSCASIPQNVKLWHPFNKLTPRQVFQFSAKKIKWNCFVCNNTYKQSPSTKNKQLCGCPVCKHKTERKIYDFLKSQNIKVKREFKLNYCTKKYDFFLKEFNVLIEIDGFQHFQDVKHFKSKAKQNQDNDIAKMKKAMLQNYSFVRLFQEDVLFDKINWEQIIKDNLFKRTIPTVTYYAKTTELYNSHKYLMLEKN